MNGSGRDDDLQVAAVRGQVDAKVSTVSARISGSEATSDKLQLNGRGGDDSVRIGRGEGTECAVGQTRESAFQ